jgi:GT2 family glycosyltransferase
VTDARRPVAVVILTWNALEWTKRCIAALRASTDHPSWRLIAVDNGSTDGTVEWLQNAGDLTLLTNKTNLGFSKGCNIGIARREAGEDVVLMNNDVVVTDPAWLVKLQDAAFTEPDTGVVGVRLVNEDGRIAHLGSYMPPSTPWGQQMGGLELDINQARRDRPAESVVFAQVYLRHECIDRIGGLDEDFFAYFEDTDYCLRASRAGFGVRYTGAARTVSTSGRCSTSRRAPSSASGGAGSRTAATTPTWSGTRSSIAPLATPCSRGTS